MGVSRVERDTGKEAWNHTGPQKIKRLREIKRHEAWGPLSSYFALESNMTDISKGGVVQNCFLRTRISYYSEALFFVLRKSPSDALKMILD